MKNRLKRIAIGLGSTVLVISLIVIAKFISFMTNTIQRGKVHDYCIDNTAIGATSFVRYGITSDPLYAFWIAKDGSSNLQEIFIFKKDKFGFLDHDRFSYVYHKSSNQEVGSMEFMPRDDKNKNKLTHLLVFYSSNKYRITDYIITFYENGDICTKRGKVSRDQAFITSISNLGTKDGVTRQFVKAEFFDDAGNLVQLLGKEIQ